MKKARIDHKKQEHKKNARVRDVLNAVKPPSKLSNSISNMSNCSSNISGKTSNMPNSLCASNNPYSAKSKELFPYKKKTKHDTPTRAPTKRGREDSISPAPVRSSSSEGALPKKRCRAIGAFT